MSSDTTISRQHARSVQQYFSEGPSNPLREAGAEYPLPVGLTTQATEQGDLRASNMEVEIEPRYITLANAGNRQATFRLLGNTTLGGTYNYTYENEDNLISEVDTSGTTVTGGTELASFVVAAGESASINLAPFRIRIPPSLALTVSAVQNAGGSAGNLTAALTWYEDV